MQGFFTVNQLAELLQIDRKTVIRTTINRGCPHTKCGNETFFTDEHFTKWLQANEQTNLTHATEV
jgi:excisionase family DNA binding protein